MDIQNEPGQGRYLLRVTKEAVFFVKIFEAALHRTRAFANLSEYEGQILAGMIDVARERQAGGGLGYSPKTEEEQQVYKKIMRLAQ